MARRKRAFHGGAHKYMRIQWKSRKERGEPYVIFKCMLVGCNHYVPREMVVGNESICWRCGKTFQMVMASTYLKKPHCPSCTKGKEGEPVPLDDVTANLEKIIGGV